MPLAALKRVATSFLTPRNGSPSSAAGPESLFPVVTVEEDGEDCNHDCDACPGYGRAFDKIGVETSDKLWGQVKKYSTHVVVATGENDWIRDVEEIKGSVMRALANEKASLESGRMMISASDQPVPEAYHEAKDGEEKPTTVLLLPAFVVVEEVKPSDAQTIITEYVNKGPTTDTPLETAPADKSVEGAAEETTPAFTAFTGPLKSHSYPHSFLILICSHRHRDARCGISAPILRKEFEKHLRPLGLWRDHTDTRPGGASVVFINHVGGHKYSANVIIYRKEDGQGMWLARVAPKHVEGIVKHTLAKGRVVHPDMVRGGFNRKEGLASW
ncbi:Sucrase/ferredoxin-like-domain-containing protein [Sphaerosporella brunnea]|uniref:Sucrase/ferredoxin-like-domain-containing protein n=1 Tax=Sphaerosporella brunnea TaxID=1250544 RepID=A0A5J5F3T7_9PEZI|nr:Sucrase/ferredoxin-like-domain-containing protein [Sphaerosporella brunnea]